MSGDPSAAFNPQPPAAAPAVVAASDPWAAFNPQTPASDTNDSGGGRLLTIRPKGQSTQAAPSTWANTAADLAQSAATGIERGAIGAMTLPQNAEVMLHQGLDYLINPVLNRVLGPAPAQPAPTPGTLHDAAVNTDQYVGAPAVIRGIENLPHSGPMYQPQSTAGQYAQTIGEFVGGGGPRAGMAALKYTLAPALASEAVGQATQGTALEPWARTAAALAAGGAAALASRPGSAASALRDAAGSVDQPTVDAAQRLMDAAQAQGSPISLAEAVQQVTNNGTRLGSLQRVVEQSAGGADTMGRFYAPRPGQVQQAGDAAISRIGTPPPVPVDGSIGPVQPNPAAVGPLVQDAAQAAIGASPRGQQASAAIQGAGPRVTPEQAGQVIQPGLGGVYDARLAARAAQARSDYAAAGPDTIPPDGVQGILDDLQQQIAADKTGLLAPRLADLRNRLSTQAQTTGFERDPAYEAPATGEAPPFGPTEDYVPRATAARPAGIPRPQSLQDFIKQAGGIQDKGGDLKSLGFDSVRGVIAKPGQGLSVDAMRQAAAQAGFLGPDIDSAMANTTPNDLYDALERHPVYSVHDAGATDAWNAYDQARSDADRLGRPASQSARAPIAPGFPDIDPPATVTQRVPITDVENLNRVRKTFRDRIDLPATAPRALDKETAAVVGPHLQRLDQVMQNGSAAYARANQNFAANSVPLQPFENTPALALAVERDPYGSRFTTPAEQVPGMIERGGPSTARAFNDVAPNPVRTVFENHLTTQMLDAASQGGTLSADRLATAMQGNADTLRQFPAVQARLQRIIDTQHALAPMRDTMVGKLASTRNYGEQASIILDPNPVPGSAAEVGDAVRQVAEQNPHAARALVSQRIQQVFNEAGQSNMGGPNQAAGAKFAAVIRGNTQQARNLKAAVEALHGPGMWRDFQQTLDVFEAMGRRQAPGSQTEFNRQISGDLRKGGKLGDAVSTIASPTKAFGKARDIYEGWKYGKNTEALARMLTRPDAAKVLGDIAKTGPDSSRSQGMLTMYLLNSAANQGREAIP